MVFLVFLKQANRQTGKQANQKSGKPNSAFTMIELMLAVAILSVGIVLILRSLNSQILVLDRLQNQYLAARIASEKLEELEHELIRDKRLDEKVVSEEVNFLTKSFSLNIELTRQVIDMEKFPQISSDQDEISQFPQIKDELQKVQVRVNYKQRGIPQELIFTTYLDANLENN